MAVQKLKIRTQFEVVDEPVLLPGMAPKDLYTPHVQYPAIAKHYGLPETERKPWQEKIAAWQLSHPDKVGWITSYDVLAMRQGILPLGDKLPPNMAVVGLVCTADHYIVIGKRGGDITRERVKLYGSGLFGTVPMGALTWHPRQTLIEDSLFRELEEELGVQRDQVVSSELLGAFGLSGESFPGIKVVTRVHVKLTLNEVIEQQKKAKDAWEHISVTGIQDELFGSNQIQMEQFILPAREALKIHKESLSVNRCQ